MHQRITSLKANPNEWTLRQLLEQWVHYLQDHDRSAATIKKYTQAVDHFLSWHEHEEQSPLILSALTPIALIGYRNALHHDQHKSKSTVNVQISALRS
jgi:site-specific recombinase XerD